MHNNLLSGLYNWAHRQDENFLTEAFVHLLRYLLQNAPDLGTDIISRISGGACCLKTSEAELITVSTQVTTDIGRPDIEIRSPHCLVLVEVKKESGLGHRQLRRYRSILDRSGFEIKKLVLLTRHPVTLLEDGEIPDVELRWMQVGEWLDGYQATSAVTQFIITQFLEFLSDRGIRMEKVGWQLVDGQKSLRSLITIMGEAIASNNLKIHQRTAGWDWIGYYLEGKSCFFGYYFDEPNAIRFEGYLPKWMKTERLSFGEIVGTQWNNRLDLSSEEQNFFFSQSKTNQFKLVESFLQHSWLTFQKACEKN